MHTTTKWNWLNGTLALAFAGAMQFASPVVAKDHSDLTLNAPAGGAANGRARLVLANAGVGRLDLRVRGLAADASFDVLVGDVKVGTLRTTGGGQGGLRFRTQPHGRDQMLGFDPRGALITIRDAAGVDVLLGTLPVASGGGNDKIVCCVPDDRGDECEDRTADDCTARGGTPAASTSCLPNPCAVTAPPPADIVCCIPDDSGPECEDRSAAECAAAGGVVVSATSCADNPCAATPPADPDIQCCIADDSGPECEDRTPAQCTAQGGVNMGPGTCSPNPCAAVSTPTTGGDDAGGHGHNGGGGGSGGNDDHRSGGGDDRGGNAGTYY